MLFLKFILLCLTIVFPFDIINTVNTDDTDNTGGNMIFDGKESIYLQIFNEYKKYIELGVYQNGDKLPSVRVLAEQFGINPNTVQRAYQLLEESGYIKTVNKKGVYVCFSIKTDNLFFLEHAKKEFLELKKKGITKDEIMKLIEEVYHD